MSEPDRQIVGLIPDPKTGEFIGQHPDDISEENLRALGHDRTRLLGCMRTFCIDCSGGSPAEARKCSRVRCPLWPYRLGKRLAVRRCSELGAAALAARSAGR